MSAVTSYPYDSEAWAKTEWARSRGTDRIHRKSCRYAFLPWLYVAGWTEDEVIAEVTIVPWLRFGKCCVDQGGGAA